jgi:hypothetical protein
VLFETNGHPEAIGSPTARRRSELKDESIGRGFDRRGSERPDPSLAVDHACQCAVEHRGDPWFQLSRRSNRIDELVHGTSLGP